MIDVLVKFPNLCGSAFNVIASKSIKAYGILGGPLYLCDPLSIH